MKRNIITNLVITTDKVTLMVLEKLVRVTTEVFTRTDKLENHHNFIKQSLQDIQALIGAKIVNISIIIEPFNQMEEKIQVVSESIDILNKVISSQDIKNLMALTFKKYQSPQQEVILVQPISFEVNDVITKTYNLAPIDKQGHALTMTAAITTISKTVYDFISKMVASHNLKISQILLTPQALSFNNISENAQSQGAALLSIENRNSYLTIVRNYAVVSLLKFNDLGYDNLLQIIAKQFECDIWQAHKLLIVYSDVIHSAKIRIINSNNFFEFDNKAVKTNVLLNEIIEDFLSKILYVTKSYLNQKLNHQYNNFPIVISGLITKIQGLEEFCRHKLNSELVTNFSPLTYIEQNSDNLYGLGALKFMDKSNQVSTLRYDTILETNPETVESLGFNVGKSRGIFSKILRKIGGKYGWS